MKAKRSTFPSAAFVLFLPSLAFAQPASPRPWDWLGPWHMGAGWGFWLLPLLVLLVIVLCLALLSLGQRAGAARHADRRFGDPAHPALQLLNERFARGEIERPEYEEKKAAILAGTRER